MLRVMFAFFFGYLLGTRAGRKELDELRDACVTIAGSQTVQDLMKTGASRLGALRPAQLLETGRGVMASPAVGQLLSGLTQRAVALATNPRKAA